MVAPRLEWTCVVIYLSEPLRTAVRDIAQTMQQPIARWARDAMEVALGSDERWPWPLPALEVFQRPRCDYSLRVTKSLHKRVYADARRRHVSASHWVMDALLSYLAQCSAFAASAGVEDHDDEHWRRIALAP